MISFFDQHLENWRNSLTSMIGYPEHLCVTMRLLDSAIKYINLKHVDTSLHKWRYQVTAIEDQPTLNCVLLNLRNAPFLESLTLEN
jgi:hypothetical protein